MGQKYQNSMGLSMRAHEVNKGNVKIFSTIGDMTMIISHPRRCLLEGIKKPPVLT